MNIVLWLVLMADPSAKVAVTDAVCAARKHAQPSIPDDFAHQAGGLLKTSLKRKQICILYFGAEWCMPCREVHTDTVPILEKSWIVRTHGDGGKAHIWLIDVDADPEFTRRHLGTNLLLPTWILFENGEERGRLTGKQSAAQISKWIRHRAEVQP